MKQQTLAMAADQENGFERYRKPTRRDRSLATMGEIVPWSALCSVSEPYYPKAGNGRPPVGWRGCCGCILCSTGSTWWMKRAPAQPGQIEDPSTRGARVEHVFAVMKRLWGFTKVRYRGLAKNATRRFVALGLANLYLARGKLAA